MNYPDRWPKPSYSRPRAVASRITERQKTDLYNRRISTRDLAKILGVNESYLSSLFPTKEAPDARAKKVLIGVRKEFRKVQVDKVLAGALEIGAAALICRVSYRTMARSVQQVRESIVATILSEEAKNG